MKSMQRSWTLGAVALAGLATWPVGCGGSSDDAATANDGGADVAAFATDGGHAIGKPGDPGLADGSTSGHGDGSTDGSAADGSSHVTAGSCGMANAPTGFISSVSVKVGSATRTYALTVPAGYNGTKLYPLVIGFHGDGGTGAGYRGDLAIEAAAAGNAIFAWPNGTNNNNGHSFDQSNDPPNNADVSFFDALVAQVEGSYCVDKNKVWTHGMSGGAYFVNQLGRWRPTVVKAVAPQSGGGPYGNQNSDFSDGNLTLTGAIPAFIIHGDADSTVALSEGQKSLAYWRSDDKSASGEAASSPSPCQRQNGGTDPVYWCVIPGMGHTIWSGAPGAIWGFYSGL